MLLDAGVLILERDYFEGLVGAEGQQEEVQDEFVREPVVADILLKWGESYLLDKVHLHQ